MSDETIELLSCPFCGGKPQMTVREHGCWVYCPHCGASGDGSDVMYGAAAAWNRRQPDAAPGEAELGRELIAWAASSDRIGTFTIDGKEHWCCEVCDPGIADTHAADCLHLRARALRDSE